MPLRSLNPGLVKDLQEKYPDAMVSIQEQSPESTPEMDDRQFWDIIAQLDWGRKRSDDIMATAVEALSRYPEEGIFRFDQMLAEKLFTLDGELFARPLGWGGEVNSNFSVDAFLYARCCAVANGKDFYEKVLENPQLIPKEHSFEPLLYLAEKAYRMKTGTDGYDFLPSVSYETFSNHAAWNDIPPLQDLINSKIV